MPVAAVPITVPPGADADRYTRSAVVVVVVVVGAVARVVRIAAVIIRPRNAGSDAYAARACVETDLCHRRHGGKDRRCRDKSKSKGFHAELSSRFSKEKREAKVVVPKKRAAP